MADFYKNHPFVSATKFDMQAIALDDGSSAYGTYVGGGTGAGVLGSTLLGRAIQVTTSNGALTGSPTGLKIGLLKADDANLSTNMAVVSGTETEFATPAASTKHVVVIDLSKFTIDATKYYGVGAALNGGGTTALTITTHSTFLDPNQAS